MIKVAGIQYSCGNDVDENLEKAKKLISVAANKDAKIICFHEMFNLFWFPSEENKEYFNLAEPVDGKSISTMQHLAKFHGVTLICSFFEVSEGKYYNSAAIIGEMGEIIGVYRKNHIPSLTLWHEDFYFTPGDNRFPVFDLGEIKIGVQVCWDNFFPEGVRILALKGANIVFAPSAAAYASQDRWKMVISSNALVNNIFMMRINRCGRDQNLDFYGESFGVSPEGIITEGPTNQTDAVLLMEIDLKLQVEAKRQFSFIRQRRPEIYGEIIKKYHGLNLITQE
jgi:N-carbamoylputrescine amidase